MRVSFSLTGGDRIDRLLANLDSSKADELMESALVAGAMPLVNRIKKTVPVKTGTYKRSWHIGGHVEKTPDAVLSDPNAKSFGMGGQLGQEVGQRWGTVPKPDGTRGQRRIFVGSGCPYGPYLEYGTSRMPARPNVRNAMQDAALRKTMANHARKALEIMIRELAK